MYNQQASPTEELCERSADPIFEKEENGAKIEVRFLSHLEGKRYERAEQPSHTTSTRSQEKC
jgi:hypothetical protein